MSLDSYDRYKIETIVTEAQKSVLSHVSKENEATRKQMSEAFNRIASALEGLTEEVRELRAELNPALDKPRKLPPPAREGGA